MSGALRFRGPEDVAEWCQARVVGWQEEVFVFDLAADGRVIGRGGDAEGAERRVAVLAWPGFGVPIGPSVAAVLLACATRVLGDALVDVSGRP